MKSRALFTLLLGIFWFLYPPQAYAECKQCKLKEAAASKRGDSKEIKGWDTDKTTWNKKSSPSDQPIKVKKKKTDQ